jgi:hypothetical protein
MSALGFFINLTLPTALWPWGRNENQEYFLGGKGGRCVGLTNLPHLCADCLEILGALTSWSPYGPVEACNSIEFTNVVLLVVALFSQSDTYSLSGPNIRYISAFCFQSPPSTPNSTPPSPVWWISTKFWMICLLYFFYKLWLCRIFSLMDTIVCLIFAGQLTRPSSLWASNSLSKCFCQWLYHK